MNQKVKSILEAKWFENTIALVAVICTIASLWLGVCQVKKTIKNESQLIQKATMLEQTGKLPDTMQEFLRKASLTLVYKIAYDNEKKEEYKQLFEKYNDEQSALLDELTGLIVAYGSEEAISIFAEFYYPLREFVSAAKAGESNEFDEWIEMYYSLPLLMAIVKYDTTGELINPSVMLRFLMPEFETINPSIMEELVIKNNKLVIEYKLDNNFKWND